MTEIDIKIRQIIDLLGGSEYSGPARTIYMNDLREVFQLLNEIKQYLKEKE